MLRHLTSILVPTAFRIFLVWYLIALLLELLFPGMVSAVIRLDFFLWTVILLAVFSFFIHRTRA